MGATATPNNIETQAIGQQESTLTRDELDEQAVTELRRDLDLISREELAAATGRSVRALKRDAVMRRGPKPIRCGMSVFYLRSQVRRHLAELAKGE